MARGEQRARVDDVRSAAGRFIMSKESQSLFSILTPKNLAAEFLYFVCFCRKYFKVNSVLNWKPVKLLQYWGNMFKFQCACKDSGHCILNKLK